MPKASATYRAGWALIASILLFCPDSHAATKFWNRCAGVGIQGQVFSGAGVLVQGSLTANGTPVTGCCIAYNGAYLVSYTDWPAGYYAVINSSVGTNVFTWPLPDNVDVPCQPAYNPSTNLCFGDVVITNTGSVSAEYAAVPIPPDVAAGGVTAAAAYAASPSVIRYVKRVVARPGSIARITPVAIGATIAAGTVMYLCEKGADYLFGETDVDGQLLPLTAPASDAQCWTAPAQARAPAKTEAGTLLDQATRQEAKEQEEKEKTEEEKAEAEPEVQQAIGRIGGDTVNAGLNTVAAIVGAGNIFGVWNFEALPENRDVWLVTYGLKNGVPQQFDFYPPVVLGTIFNILQTLRPLLVLMLAVGVFHNSARDVFAAISACAGLTGVKIPNLMFGATALGSGLIGNMAGIASLSLKSPRAIVSFFAVLGPMVLFWNLATTTGLVAFGQYMPGAGTVLGEGLRMVNEFVPLGFAITLIGARLAIAILGYIALVSHVPRVLEPE